MSCPTPSADTPTTMVAEQKVDDMTRPTEAQESSSAASETDNEGSSLEEQIKKAQDEEDEPKTVSDDNKSPETDTGKASAKRTAAPCGRSRKSTGEMESLFNRIINLIDTAEDPNNVTLSNIRETVAKCRVTLAELTSRRKRRTPGAVRKASQRKKRDSEQAAEPPATSTTNTAPVAAESKATAKQTRSLTRNNNNAMPVVRMRGPPAAMFYGGDFWQPPYGGVPPDLVSPAAVYFESGRGSPMFGGPPQMMASPLMVDWRFPQRQGGSRRARDRRDRLVQEKEQAIIRAELRAARTPKDYERAIEKAKRQGMDYEVQSATLRLEKMTD